MRKLLFWWNNKDQVRNLENKIVLESLKDKNYQIKEQVQQQVLDNTLGTKNEYISVKVLKSYDELLQEFINLEKSSNILIQEFKDILADIKISTKFYLFWGKVFAYNRKRDVFMILNFVRHFPSQGLSFVLGGKFVINKAWLKDKNLEKWVKTPLKIFKVPGYSIVEKFIVLTDGKVLKKTKTVYHKFDFDKAISETDLILNVIAKEIKSVAVLVKAVLETPEIGSFNPEEVDVVKSPIKSIIEEFTVPVQQVPVPVVQAPVENVVPVVSEKKALSNSVSENHLGPLVAIITNLAENMNNMAKNVNVLTELMKNQVVKDPIVQASEVPVVKEAGQEVPEMVMVKGDQEVPEMVKGDKISKLINCLDARILALDNEIKLSFQNEINVLTDSIENLSLDIESISSIIRKKVLRNEFAKNNLSVFDIIQPYMYASKEGLFIIKDRLSSIKDRIIRLNMKRGFVCSTNFFNPQFFPIICDVIKLLITEEKFKKLNNSQKTSVFVWTLQLVLINFHTICNVAIRILVNNQNDLDYETKVLLKNFEYLANWSHKLLDNSIKQHLVRRYPSVTSDIITGFDTEFVPIDMGVNELISAQVSLSTELKLSVPLFQDYKFEGLSTLTDEAYLKSLPPFEKPDWLINFISNKIKDSRLALFGNYDLILNKMVNKIIKDKDDFKLKNMALTSGSVNFAFDKTPIKNILILAPEGERLKLNFKTLIKIITDRTNRSELENLLMDKLKTLNPTSESEFINYDNLNKFIEELDLLNPSWNGKTLVQEPVEEFIVSNKYNDFVTNEKEEKISKKCLKINISNSNFVVDPVVDTPNNYLSIASVSVSEKENQGGGVSFVNIAGGLFVTQKKKVVDPINPVSGEIPRDYKASFEVVEQGKEEVVDRNWNIINEKPVTNLEDDLKEIIFDDLKLDLNDDYSYLLPNRYINVNFVRKLYLCAHYNAADLEMLEDWNTISRQNIDIIKKCYSSLTLPVKYNGQEKVFIRDSLLLSSAAAASLEKVAYGYGMKKVDVPQDFKENMDLLLKEDFSLFKAYAMNDSLITLIHVLFMKDFAFKLGSLRIPNTLGTISSRYIKNKWNKDSYRGYQIDYNYPLGDVQNSHTPKGIQFTGLAGEASNLYIGSYRGGRNECFKYGIDRSTKWFDYDLTSCYSTVMSMLGDPEYDIEDTEIQELAKLVDVQAMIGSPDHTKEQWLSPASNLDKFDFINSYTTVKVKFNLPDAVKFPPLPVTLDKNITIYPLSGETLVSGLEYITAKRILDQVLLKMENNGEGILNHLKKKYFINVLYGCYIPFKKDDHPFFNVINELQAKRREAKKLTGKHSSSERIYKDLGNMLYGKIVCGLSNKNSYDARTLTTKKVIGNDLANPIVGTWITAFVRSLIAELLFKTDALGGNIVSCTTDGFVTDIPDLENKIISSFEQKDSLLSKYRDIRVALSGDPSGLEVKTDVDGIIQWATRGQLSLKDNGTPITAMTGYQKNRIHNENVDLVENALHNGNRIYFLQKRLTGALDSYKNLNKRHVSLTSNQRSFKTIYDSKRFVNFVENAEFLDTRPFNDVSEALLHRKIMVNGKTSIYSNTYSRFEIYPSTNSKAEVLKYFIRMICHIYNYNVPLRIKKVIINILIMKKLINDKNDGWVLSLFSVYESEKGNIVTKLPINRNSVEYVKSLHEGLLEANQDVLIQDFLTYFDNFKVLPRSEVVLRARKEELRQQLIKRVSETDLDCLHFDFINNGEVKVIFKE